MLYPDEAKILALSSVVKAIIGALHTRGAIDGELLIRHVATAKHHLEASGEVIAAEALVDFFNPIAAAIMEQSANAPKRQEP